MKTERGVTLLEAMLALAIAGSIITMGIAWYASFTRDSDIRKVAENVDKFAFGAANFYYMHCFGLVRANGQHVKGLLHPEHNPPPPDPYVIDIKNQLIDSKLLTATIPINPLVDGATATDGYIVQLSRTDIPKMICPETPDCAESEKKRVGTTVDYTIQIGVKMRDTTNIKLYEPLTGAGCVSSKTSKDAVVSCTNVTFVGECQALRESQTADPDPAVRVQAKQDADAMDCPDSADAEAYNNYLVFERKPSAALSTELPVMWPSTPLVHSFTRPYRIKPYEELLSNPAMADSQYFLCGS